jgi:hypothetical protein
MKPGGSWGGYILLWEFLFGEALIEAKKQQKFKYSSGDPCRRKKREYNFLKGGR